MFGIVILCSLNSGNIYPWGINQFIRFLAGLFVMLVAVSTPSKVWNRYSHFLYAVGMILLISVIAIGKISMGAQRWLTLGGMNFQPSELMKVFLVFALAKYLSSIPIDAGRKTIYIIAPVLLILVPAGLVMIQPDLGTAMMLLLVGAAILFAYGVQIWKFGICLLGVCISAPIIWSRLHDYQKKRILMFMDPESDPCGAGYHIIQSKIALGSGGFSGQGLANGSQSRLNFLPEKQTDFVFSALGEDLGFIGCSCIILLYIILIQYNIYVALRAKNKFDKILVFGFSAMLFFYVAINISMVCGLLPVVGVPLPFFSYGGSALVVLMFFQGIVFSVDISNRHGK